jgi:hypothetical protein
MKITAIVLLALVSTACDTTTPDDAQRERVRCIIEQLATIPLSTDELLDLSAREAQRMALAFRACRDSRASAKRS